MKRLYEIRCAGITLCCSMIPNLGYSKEVLRDMERSGLHLYCNGKREKAASRAANTESGRLK